MRFFRRYTTIFQLKVGFCRSIVKIVLIVKVNIAGTKKMSFKIQSFAIVFFAFVYFAPVQVSDANAGVILDTNGFVTSADLTVNGTTTTVYMVLGSYNSVNAIYDLTDEPWHYDQLPAEDAKALALSYAVALSDLLNASTENPNVQPNYYFALLGTGSGGTQLGEQRSTRYSGLHPIGWRGSNASLEPDTTASDYFYATLNNPAENSQVPEPGSLAIIGSVGLMGLAYRRTRRPRR